MRLIYPLMASEKSALIHIDIFSIHTNIQEIELLNLHLFQLLLTDWVVDSKP